MSSAALFSGTGTWSVVLCCYFPSSWMHVTAIRAALAQLRGNGTEDSRTRQDV